MPRVIPTESLGLCCVRRDVLNSFRQNYKGEKRCGLNYYLLDRSIMCWTKQFHIKESEPANEKININRKKLCKSKKRLLKRKVKHEKNSKTKWRKTVEEIKSWGQHAIRIIRNQSRINVIKLAPKKFIYNIRAVGLQKCAFADDLTICSSGEKDKNIQGFGKKNYGWWIRKNIEKIKVMITGKENYELKQK